MRGDSAGPTVIGPGVVLEISTSGEELRLVPGILIKTDIRDRTEEYWKKCRNAPDCYVDELIGYELTYARDHPLTGETTRLQGLDEPVHTLAITVGESFEPLLQVTCVLRPRRVVLLLNNLYHNETPGEDHGDTLKRLMMRLADAPEVPAEMRPSLRKNDFDCVVLRVDTPTEVFRDLRDAMQKQEAKPPSGYVNAVDITGAKKSMVVGAFLYAAHSGLPITYVDFDEYSNDWGKPYGYTCKIGQIANPYEAFRLRDWEQVRQFYNSYNFRGASMMLGRAKDLDNPSTAIIAAMAGTFEGSNKGRGLYEDTDVAKVVRLKKIMEICEAWENGDYGWARQQLDEFQPPLPQDVIPWGIMELGSIWPTAIQFADPRLAADHLLKMHLELKNGKPHPGDSIFGQPLRLVAYVRDEAAKIERLISKNEDYRSAFLRAAGLEEFLLKARLSMCWLAGVLDVTVGKTEPAFSTSLDFVDQARGFGAIAGHSSADAMRDTLRRRQTLPLGSGMQVQLSASAPNMDEYWKDKMLDFDAFLSSWGNPGFTRLRGEAIHTHLYIPKHVAEAALELVCAAVDELEKGWIEHFYPGTLSQASAKLVEAPAWHRLCEVCELEFLPPRLRN